MAHKTRVNGTIYEINLNTTKLISFYLNYKLYYAEEGMTFNEWVSSEYNTSDLGLFFWTYINSSRGGTLAYYTGGSEWPNYFPGVYATTVIHHGYRYDSEPYTH